MDAGEEKSPSSMMMRGSATNFCATATDWRGSDWESWKSYSMGRPLMPPALLMASRARSKPRFHCAPYCALGPVRGPLTPATIGSAAWEARGTAVVAAVARRGRRGGRVGEGGNGGQGGGLSRVVDRMVVRRVTIAVDLDHSCGRCPAGSDRVP